MNAAQIYLNAKGNLANKVSCIARSYGVCIEKMPLRYKQNIYGEGWANGSTDGKTIFLASLKDKYDLFTFLHELKHVIQFSEGMTKEQYEQNPHKYEKEADDFATETMVEIFGNKIKALCITATI